MQNTQDFFPNFKAFFFNKVIAHLIVLIWQHIEQEADHVLWELVLERPEYELV